jgi:hypothetical protein
MIDRRMIDKRMIDKRMTDRRMIDSKIACIELNNVKPFQYLVYWSSK